MFIYILPQEVIEFFLAYLNNNELNVLRQSCTKMKNKVESFLEGPRKKIVNCTIYCQKSGYTQHKEPLFFWRNSKFNVNTFIYLTIVVESQELHFELVNKLNIILSKYIAPKIFLTFQCDNDTYLLEQFRFIICKLFVYIKQIILQKPINHLNRFVYDLICVLIKPKMLMHEDINFYSKTSKKQNLRNIVSRNKFQYDVSELQSTFILNF